MSVIDDFAARYGREFDYYQEAARHCAQRCESSLEQSGIRSIVTFRAKRLDRLIEKVAKRSKGAAYKTVDDIYADVIDLAGVRIALYFPADINEVEGLIQGDFIVEKTKMFPDPLVTPAYPKRFSGYGARHYRIRLRSKDLPSSSQRYSDTLIEVQVASVLMHAWSEVEHDLVYKPMSGTLSEDEYAILDELNGLVLSGEIALERLQRAAKARLANRGAKFNNHYELAAYIYDRITKSNS
jgi:ppGpp synthetase/RelA/SpoT-type nucleotidyltranferase